MAFAILRLSTAVILALLVALLATCALADESSKLVAEADRNSNQSLFWGPYKPNLYFGVRPRLPKSLTAGLLWARTDNFVTVQRNFRHTCEQHEGMAGYGWDEYDVRSGGQQTIHDAGNNIDITTSFVKFPGGEHGGSWAVRVKGVPREDAPPALKSTMIFYASLEGEGDLEVENERDETGYDGDVTIAGKSEGLGEYKLVITEGKGNHPENVHPSFDDKPLDRTIVHSFEIPEEILWHTKPILFKNLKDEIDGYIQRFGEKDMPPPWQVYTISNDPGHGNLHMVQKVFEGEFEFDVIFNSGSAGKEITTSEVTKQIESVTKSFRSRFIDTFAPASPFNKPKYETFAKSMFSNLIGGIGYFYGDSVADRSNAPEYDEENEGFWEETAEARGRRQESVQPAAELYTSIPSRPFFPRGFLWDEGFHLIPIADWDMDLTLEIVKSWFNLIDEDGWIGREQILGPEARSKVPVEFQTQYPHYANPPTLFLILENFIDRLTAIASGEKSAPAESLQTAHLANRELANQYLAQIFPLLQRQYDWFQRTQFGDLKSYDREAFSSKHAYRWRGRTVQHILTSGMDDYPRPQPPHPGELHVDLISWMGMLSRSLKRIATFIGAEEDAAKYAKDEAAILRNIDDLHWSEKEGTYCDATIDDYEEHVHVCHKGYVSIFPFLTGLLDPKSEKLGKVLDLLGDEEELFSPYGIRSLSKKDEHYGTGENYWRGPVWMNMNYLAVAQLLKYAQTPGPHQEKSRKLYQSLRSNLVETVFNSWEETGFAWEQYNPETGAGQRTQHFTGWTSLVVKIMNMPDLSGSTHDEL